MEKFENFFLNKKNNIFLIFNIYINKNSFFFEWKTTLI
jgi:hypothetical protein